MQQRKEKCNTYIKKDYSITVDLCGEQNEKLDHVERKVPKYENHKLRERKVISSIPGKSFHFPFP